MLCSAAHFAPSTDKYKEMEYKSVTHLGNGHPEAASKQARGLSAISKPTSAN